MSVPKISSVPTISLISRKNDYDKFRSKWNKIRDDDTHPKHLQCCEYRISDFKLYEKDGKELSIGVLTQGLKTYLPETDVISLFDNNFTSRMFIFSSFISKFRDRLEKLTTKTNSNIVYYKCEFFPTEDEIKDLTPFCFP